MKNTVNVNYTLRKIEYAHKSYDSYQNILTEFSVVEDVKVSINDLKFNLNDN